MDSASESSGFSSHVLNQFHEMSQQAGTRGRGSRGRGRGQATPRWHQPQQPPNSHPQQQSPAFNMSSDSFPLSDHAHPRLLAVWLPIIQDRNTNQNLNLPLSIMSVMAPHESIRSAQEAITEVVVTFTLNKLDHSNSYSSLLSLLIRLNLTTT